MTFVEWLQLQGCEVEIVQEDEGNGYVVCEVRPPMADYFPLTKVTVDT